MGWQKWLLLMVCAVACAWAMVKAVPTSHAGQTDLSVHVTSGVFTTAHPTAAQAVRDFLDFHPEHPVQPIAYTHTVHLANGLQCEFCHVGVDQGPEAQIPGVAVCMTCHVAIEIDAAYETISGSFAGTSATISGATLVPATAVWWDF